MQPFAAHPVITEQEIEEDAYIREGKQDDDPAQRRADSQLAVKQAECQRQPDQNMERKK